MPLHCSHKRVPRHPAREEASNTALLLDARRAARPLSSGVGTTMSWRHDVNTSHLGWIGYRSENPVRLHAPHPESDGRFM